MGGLGFALGLNVSWAVLGHTWHCTLPHVAPAACFFFAYERMLLNVYPEFAPCTLRVAVPSLCGRVG